MLDLPEGNAMRAPGEAPGLMALEIAMDEMAEKLGMDPVEFRIVNDTQVDPEKPERPLLAAPAGRMPAHGRGAVRLDRGATPSPAQVRDGDWLVGMGVAAGFRNNLLMKSAARVRLDRDGRRDGRDRHDRHRHRQLHDHRADRGRDDGRRRSTRSSVKLGDSDFPASAGSGGQWGANSSTAGVYAACVKLREAVAQKLGFDSADAMFADGQGPLPAIARVALPRPRATARLVAEDVIEYGDLDEQYQQSTFAAHFVEVGGRRLHRRDPRPPDARGVRGRAHPQPEDGAQPGDRRDDDGRRRGADGGAGGRHALRLLRQSRPGRLRSAGPRRHSAPGRDLPRRGRPTSRRR